MKRFLKYIIPSILSMWVYALYTMVDGFFVSNFCGEVEFSAINISMPIVTSFFALGILFSIGTQALVGFNLGQKNIKTANEVFTTGIVSILFVGILYTILISVFLRDIIEFLGSTSETHDYVYEYLRTVVPFGVFFMTTYQLEVLVKVDGFPIISAVSVLVAALTNLLLDYVFIAQFDWGLRGAALGTGIAQVVSTALMTAHFLKRRGNIAFSKSINFKNLKKTLPLGGGDALAEIAIGYTVLLFNTTLQKYMGKEGVIIYTVISYVSIFATVTMTGIAQGLAPLFSYESGRNDMGKIKRLIKLGFLSVVFIGTVFIFVLQLFSSEIVGFFLNENSELFNSATAAIMKYSSAYIFIGINVLMVTLFASLRKGKCAILISLLRTPIFITIVMKLYELAFQDDKIWFVPAVSEILTCIISIYLLNRIVFKNKKMASVN